jgi:hypothetical protein
MGMLFRWAIQEDFESYEKVLCARLGQVYWPLQEALLHRIARGDMERR